MDKYLWLSIQDEKVLGNRFLNWPNQIKGPFKGIPGRPLLIAWTLPPTKEDCNSIHFYDKKEISVIFLLQEKLSTFWPIFSPENIFCTPSSLRRLTKFPANFWYYRVRKVSFFLVFLIDLSSLKMRKVLKQPSSLLQFLIRNSFEAEVLGHASQLTHTSSQGCPKQMKTPLDMKITSFVNCKSLPKGSLNRSAHTSVVLLTFDGVLGVSCCIVFHVSVTAGQLWCDFSSLDGKLAK